MHFAYAQTILQPEEIEMLAGVLDLVCPVSNAVSNELDRHETAFRLISLFQIGVRDEAELAELAGSCAGSRQAA